MIFIPPSNPNNPTNPNAGAPDSTPPVQDILKTFGVDVATLSVSQREYLLAVLEQRAGIYSPDLPPPTIDPSEITPNLQKILDNLPKDVQQLAQLIHALGPPAPRLSIDTTQYAGDIIAILKLIQRVTQEQSIKAMQRADMAAVAEAEKSMEAAKKDEEAAKTRLIATCVSVVPTIIGAVGGARAAAGIKDNAAMGGKEALYGQAMGQIGEAMSKVTDSVGNYVAVGQEAEANRLRALAKLDDSDYDHSRATAKALDDVREEAQKMLGDIVGTIIATSKDSVTMS